MKRAELVEKLAKQAGIPAAAAADEVDRVITRILANLRKGRKTKPAVRGRKAGK
jgi:nucleoid DNA-binding protein